MGVLTGDSGYLSFDKVMADPWQVLVKAKIATVLNFPPYSVLPLGLLKLIGIFLARPLFNPIKMLQWLLKFGI